MTIERVKIDGVVYDVVMQHSSKGCFGCHFRDTNTCPYGADDFDTMICHEIAKHNIWDCYPPLDNHVAIFKKAE